MKKLIITTLLAVFSAQAQVPPAAEESSITLEKVRVEQARLPEAERSWTKIIVEFKSDERWSDGLLLNAMVALEADGRVRIINGDLRLVNIPSGNNEAIFYMSPNASARFGTPVAVRISAFSKDREAGQIGWQNPAKSSFDEWEFSNVYSGILLPMNKTPWLLLDYDKSADVVSQ